MTKISGHGKRSGQQGARMEGAIANRGALEYPMDLSSLDQEILKIAKDLMQDHYLLNLESLRHHARRILKDETATAIDGAIHALISKNVFFDQRPFTRDEILENETRQRVYLCIDGHPGIHMSAIRRAVEKDSRTVLLHLRILEEFAFIRSRAINRNTVYFTEKIPEKFEMVYYYLQKDSYAPIFEAIVKYPSISFTDLCGFYQDRLSPRSLGLNVKNLMEQDLLSAKLEGNTIQSLQIAPQYSRIVKNFFGSP